MIYTLLVFRALSIQALRETEVEGERDFWKTNLTKKESYNETASRFYGYERHIPHLYANSITRLLAMGITFIYLYF